MKRRCFALILAVLFTLSTLLILPATSMPKIRWDKIPVISDFVLQIELGPSAFDASYLKEPIEWHQIDEEPADWEEKGLGGWFYLNPYTSKLLKDYMKSNNLAIVPGDWPELRFRMNLEQCLEIFEFVELGPPIKEDKTIANIGCAISCFLAIVCWIIFLGIKNFPKRKEEIND